MTEKLNWGRYTELRPDALASIRLAAPVAYLPWGALEWHGPHLPFGVDGFTAEHVAERAVQRTGGVLLPTTWWPITALPHPDSLSIRSDIVRQLWDEIVNGLATAGWEVVVLLSGHYAQGHELVLMEMAEAAMQRHGLLVLALPPLALVDEEMLDHAALWESSQMLSLRPELVDLDRLGDEPLHPASSAVLGRDPRAQASASLGERVLTMAVERIVRAVEQLRTDPNPGPLLALYRERRRRYQSYVKRYASGTWE
ncbi:MAG: creatininase family protein, partial [Chloroflexaceae bacterium]|nr:creatininase family protein [Chloroflexaceae bacterium]